MCTDREGAEAYSALSVTDSLNYASVKAVVLMRWFPRLIALKPLVIRNGRKEDKQSNLESSRDLLNTFYRWRAASEVETFGELCDPIVLEQFRNVVPSCIVTYIKEQEVKTVGEAAALADQYVLTHHSDWGNVCSSGELPATLPVLDSESQRHTGKALMVHTLPVELPGPLWVVFC